MKKFFAILLGIILSISSSVGLFYVLQHKTTLFDKTETSSTIKDSSSPSEDTSAPSEDLEEVNYEDLYNQLLEESNGARLVYNGLDYNIRIMPENGPPCYFSYMNNDPITSLSLDDYNIIISLPNSNIIPDTVSRSENYFIVDGSVNNLVSLNTINFNDLLHDDSCLKNFTYSVTDISGLDINNFDSCWVYCMKVNSFSYSTESINCNIEFIVASNFIDLENYLNQN
jgi:hypothetical protein